MWEFIKISFLLATALTVGYFALNLVFIAIMLAGVGIGELWLWLCKKLKRSKNG